MRIEKLRLRNVGPFEDVTLELPAGTDPSLADVYLLTGPNGCGKTTALRAIAAALGTSTLLRTEILKRMYAKDSHVVLGTDEGTYLVRHVDGSWPREDMERYEGVRLHEVLPAGDHRFQTTAQPSDTYAARLHMLNTIGDKGLSWAAFGYAGMRSMAHGSVPAVVEVRTDPLENSLTFASIDASMISNWVVGQHFKALKAKAAGNEASAGRFERSITRIEELVSRITGDRFQFATVEANNDLYVQLNDIVIELELAPDGLKSILSWVADLMMRLERITWANDTALEDRAFLLLLDEIDVHLHPAWQRRILPAVQRTFRNAQIIATTHSPFVVASADDAHTIVLTTDGRHATVEKTEKSQVGVSVQTVLRSLFDVKSEFDVETEKQLDEFRAAIRRVQQGEEEARANLEELTQKLAAKSEELRAIVGFERAQLDRQLLRRNRTA